MITTYTKLIAGLKLSERICTARAKQAHKNGDLEAYRQWSKEAQEHFKTYTRFNLARAVCGDAVKTARP